MSLLAGRWCIFTGKLACMSRIAAHDTVEALGGFPGERIKPPLLYLHVSHCVSMIDF
jgi:NAD-dependent DNA ligase